MATEHVTVVDPDQGAGWDYASLSAWEADFGDTTGNLPADDMIAVAKCRSTGGTADTTATTVSGWTVDATRYIKIWTDPAESYRHDGKWKATAYRIVISGDPWAYLLTISQQYTRLLGIQWDAGGANHSYGLIDTAANCLIGYCIGKRNGSASGANFLIDGPSKVFNCISMDSARSGFRSSSGNNEFYNCTSIDDATGFIKDYSTPVITNCLAKGGTANFSAFGTGQLNYCASGDGTADDFGGTGNKASQPFTFVNEAADDFHLASTDTGAKDCGITNPGSGLFGDDIDGQTRSGTWDIGADEYIAAGGGPVIPVFMNQYRQRWA